MVLKSSEPFIKGSETVCVCSLVSVPPVDTGGVRIQTTMGDVCNEKKKNKKPWRFVVWQICNVVMSLFFFLASYVQVSVLLLFLNKVCFSKFLIRIIICDVFFASCRSMIRMRVCGWWVLKYVLLLLFWWFGWKVLMFLLQVGYAVPAVLCSLIGFRPEVTGRRTAKGYICIC